MGQMGSQAVPRLLCPEIVGRDAELAMAAQLTLAAAAGKAATLLISGDPGIGKSAVLRRVAEMGRREGLPVLRAECVRIEARRPFGPFVDALSGLRHESEPLAMALDGIKARDPSSASPEFDRYRAHAAIERAVAALASERPLAIVIDDLHWADEASLELFALLSRRITHALLLVGTYRSDELEMRPTLRRAVRDCARERTWEITLAALTSTDVGRALRLTLGQATHVSSAARELLQARCGGNPLFLEEILRGLAERGDLVREDDTWRLADLRAVPVPRTVRDAVHDRYRALDATTKAMLAAAAVLGERFTFAVLRDASGLQEPDLVASLRRAVDAQLIHELPDDRDKFEFRHALTRDAIADDLLRLEREVLHRKIAMTLEQQNADPAEIAYHFDEAREIERAHEWHVTAAKAAVTLGAFSEALRHFERSLELTDENTADVAALYLDAARCAFVLRQGQRQLLNARQAF
jgi:predicted ATPase